MWTGAAWKTVQEVNFEVMFTFRIVYEKFQMEILNQTTNSPSFYGLCSGLARTSADINACGTLSLRSKKEILSRHSSTGRCYIKN